MKNRLTFVEWLLIAAISLTFLLTVLTGGCARPQPQPVTPGKMVLPVANMLPTMVRLKVVRVFPGFLNTRITQKLVRARDIFASYGVGMEVVSVHEMDMPDWLAITESDQPSMDLFAKESKEHIVFLVESITIKGEPAGGAGVSRWCAIALASWDHSISHEVLHAALRLADIDQQDDRQGHRNTPLNLMANQNVTEDHVRLEEDQVDALRGWAKLRWGG